MTGSRSQALTMENSSEVHHLQMHAESLGEDLGMDIPIWWAANWRGSSM